ncbi:MAG: hypothetical protein MMC23_002977 [Stictis urceolatum]|nr:hypothetical protein [Stictis urceolata]
MVKTPKKTSPTRRSGRPLPHSYVDVFQDPQYHNSSKDPNDPDKVLSVRFLEEGGRPIGTAYLHEDGTPTCRGKRQALHTNTPANAAKVGQREKPQRPKECMRFGGLRGRWGVKVYGQAASPSQQCGKGRGREGGH